MKLLKKILSESGEGISNVTGANIETAEQPSFTKSKFAGATVYHVGTDLYRKFIQQPKNSRHAYSRYIKDEELLTDIQSTVKEFPTSSILVNNDGHGGMVFLKKGSKCGIKTC